MDLLPVRKCGRGLDGSRGVFCQLVLTVHWGVKNKAGWLYSGCSRMLLSNHEVPGAMLCLFMAPAPARQGLVTVTVPVAVWSYPGRTKWHAREHTRASWNTLVSCSRAELVTPASSQLPSLFQKGGN